MDSEYTADSLARTVEDQMAIYDVHIMDAVLGRDLKDGELLLDNRNRYLTEAESHALDCIAKPWVYCRSHWVICLDQIQVFEEKYLEDFTSLTDSPLGIFNIYTTHQVLSNVLPEAVDRNRMKIGQENQGISIRKAA